MYECGISSRKFGAAFAGFWYFFKRTIPEPGDLFSRRTLKAKFMRIQHAEMMQLRSEVEDMAASVPTHTTGYLTDCSFYGEERCVSYFTFSPKDGSGPRTVFTGIGPVADKTARACAAAALERMLYALGRAGTSNVGASCEDHAAMN